MGRITGNRVDSQEPARSDGWGIGSDSFPRAGGADWIQWEFYCVRIKARSAQRECYPPGQSASGRCPEAPDKQGGVSAIWS